MLAVVALHHCGAASLRKMRSVDREIALKVEELWTAACILRKCCADAADLNRCIHSDVCGSAAQARAIAAIWTRWSLRSRRRTTWCEFPALFLRSPYSW
jgi:hypothetical protein